jgi:hypothetical protein
VSDGGESPQPPAETFERMTMLQMAEFGAAELVHRCVLAEGEFAGKTLLVLSARQAAGLDQIVKTLAVLAQHDAVIKQAIRQAGFRSKSK